MSKQAYAGPKEESIAMEAFSPEAGFGWEIELRHIRRRLLDALFPDELELRKFSEIVRNIAAVDVQARVYNTTCLGLHRANLSPLRTIRLYVDMRYISKVYYQSAWALTLSVQLFRAMRRPQFVGQTTSSSHVFFCVW